MNQLRILVKMDTNSIKQIAEATGLHQNTITQLIKPGELELKSKRLTAANKLAEFYGRRVNVTITLEPLDSEAQ